jgi:glycoside/pentoside/hexuronide:cation symporter, GPH family
MTTSTPTRPRNGLFTKLAYGLGSVAYGVKDNGFQALLLLFYNQVLGLSPYLGGLAILLALAVDSVLDPLVGMISDNWRSRWGRRHPFMYLAGAPAAIAFYFLWRPPAGLGQGQLFLYLLATAVVVRSLITFYEIPSTALGAELSENYDQRTELFGYRYFFGWWGGLTMTVLALQVFLRPDAHHPVGQLNPEGYVTYGAVSGLVMFAAITLSAAGTHRFIPFLKAPPKVERRSPIEVLRHVGRTFGNPSFIAIMGSAIFSSMASGLTLALNSYFVTYFWLLTSAQYAILLVSAYLGAFLALVLAPALSRRIGKKTATIVIYMFTALIGPLPIILRLLGLFPPNGSPLVLPLLFLNTVVTVTLAITAGINGTSMIADIAEDNELKTGQRSEGLLFSASSVIAKSVTGVGIFLSGVVLSVVHFPEKAQPGHVPQATLLNMMYVYLPLFISIQMIAIGCLFFYRITRQQHEANLAALANRSSGAGADQPASSSAP